MRTGERCGLVADEKRVGEGVGDEFLGGVKTVRALGGVREDGVGSGEGELGGRALDVGVEFVGRKNGFEDSERIKAVDGQADADELGVLAGASDIAAVVEEAEQSRGVVQVGGGVEGELLHGKGERAEKEKEDTEATVRAAI